MIIILIVINFITFLRLGQQQTDTPISSYWSNTTDGIITSNWNIQGVVDIQYANLQIGYQEYGYGLWTKWLRTYPQYLALRVIGKLISILQLMIEHYQNFQDQVTISSMHQPKSRIQVVVPSPQYPQLQMLHVLPSEQIQQLLMQVVQVVVPSTQYPQLQVVHVLPSEQVSQLDSLGYTS